MTAARPWPGGFGLYVHWPFCLSKCPYCDFNSHVREAVDQDRWRAALLQELHTVAQAAPDRILNSIFFGGGTPSLMPPETVAAIIDAARGAWSFAPDIEITLEANPTSIEAGRFRAYRAGGVNRVSIGVQSLDPRALEFLGRNHSASEARAAIALAAEIFPRYSFDLIYARPGQTREDWRAELDEALALAGDHLSLYTLTLEPNTGFAGMVKRGVFTMPDDETVATLFDDTQEMMDARGMPAYEISNHARGDQASRHNLVYWRYGDYAAIGPGAHARLTVAGRKSARQNIRKPEAWLARVEETGAGLESETTLTSEQAAQEALLMGLRLAEGIAARDFALKTGLDLMDGLDEGALAAMVEQGFITWDGETLCATRAGRAVLDGLLARIVRAS